MKFSSLRAVAIICVMVSFIAACKKDERKEETKPVPVQLPQSTMFVSTFDSKTGTSVYLLDALTGSLITKYQYAYDANAKWSAVAAGNELLYQISANKINAIAANTGEILWSDTVSNVMPPTLNDGVFYGVSSNNAGMYEVFALDATKKTKSFLWKKQVAGETRPEHFSGLDPVVTYYNGLLYISMDRHYVAALDAQTGAVKWSISNVADPSGGYRYSLASLFNGFISFSYTAIDVLNGKQISAVTPPVVPPTYPQNLTQSSLAFLTRESSYVETSHFNELSPGWSKTYLSLIDNATGAEKWRINFSGGYVNYDSSNYVQNIWNGRLIVRKVQRQGAGKYGVTSSDHHWLTDINTASTRVDLDDDGKGLTVSTIIIGNTIYLNKRFESTLHGLPYGSDSPPANYLLAVDLNTGKQLWNIDKLLSGYTGAVFCCVYTGGKGYQASIQQLVF